MNSIKSSYTLNDSFEENNLKLQWKFFGDYDTTRFSLAGEGIKIKGKGNSVSDCSPLLCIPMDHSYEAQVEIDVEGNAIGGLTLFYSKKICSGILADNKNILANLRGWQFPTEENVINKHVYLKIRNINNVVDMYYSLNGLEWIKIRNSSEVSAFHHNVLSEFLSLRIGLVSIGEGFVIFRNFKYLPMD